MNLIIEGEFHNKFINCFCAVPANDLEKYTIKCVQIQMCWRGAQVLVYANIVTYTDVKVLYQSCINTLVSPFQLLVKCVRQTIQNAILRLFGV